MTIIRLLLSIAFVNGWFLHQLDVNNPAHVCQLQKSLYGLKWASRQWFAKLSSFLIQSGYSQSKANYSLFVQQISSSFIALLLYVNDVILAGSNMEEISHIKQLLYKKFQIKDLEDLKFFLGLEIARTKHGIFLSHRKYTLELLLDVGCLVSKPPSSPMNSIFKLSQTEGTPYEDVSGYKRLVGRLLYLTTIRPDISFVIRQLSQYLTNLMMSHYKVVLRVLWYVKSALGIGLVFFF